MSLLPLFQWLGNTPVGMFLQNSPVWYPIVEIVHLLGLAVLVGTILIVDLGLLGVGMRRQPVPQLAGALAPWTRGGLGVMFVTGPLLLSAQAMKCYDSPVFWFKMALLCLALLFYFTIHRRFTSDRIPRPIGNRLVACVSLTLWIGTGFAAKAIEFY